MDDIARRALLLQKEFEHYKANRYSCKTNFSILQIKLTTLWKDFYSLPTVNKFRYRVFRTICHCTTLMMDIPFTKTGDDNVDFIVDKEDVTASDIELIIDQTGVSPQEARECFIRNNRNAVEAIMELDKMKNKCNCDCGETYMFWSKAPDTDTTKSVLTESDLENDKEETNIDTACSFRPITVAEETRLNDIKFVMEQAQVASNVAENCLKKHNGDVVDAIMELVI